MITGIKPMKPVDGEITKGGEYGASRRHGKPHAGVDYGVPVRTPVKASLDGVVVRADFSHPRVPGDRSYGYVIVLYHGRNVNTGKHTYTLYAHLDTMGKDVGLKVNRGEEIAKSGETGGTPKNPIRPHLHFETIEAPTEIDTATPGAVPYGLYSVNPLDFLNRLFSKKSYELSDEEMDRFYKEIKTDLRLGSRPALMVDLPDYKEFIRKMRGGYPSHGVNPPKVKLRFENNFGKEFRALFPTLELEVNGRSLGRIQTGMKTYELDIWR